MKKLNELLLFMLGIIGGVVGLLFYQQRHTAQFARYERTLDPTTIIKSIKNQVQGVSETDSGFTTNFNRIKNLYSILKKNYYSGTMIDKNAMTLNATKSFVEAIGDPYTVYLDIEEEQQLNEALQGTTDFEGIGAYVAKRENGVLIEDIIKDSPAFKAGLKPLDLFIKVNDEPTKPLTIGEAVKKIKGPAGTEVSLLILRNHGKEQKIFEQTVTRDKVKINSVKSKLYTGSKNIGYIAISSVGNTTAQLFNKELTYLLSQKIDGLILDLRGNGGGFLDIAVKILSYFIPKGETVVTAKYRIFDNEAYKSEGYGKAEKLPLVVLVDGLTASAGEIITMALDELRDATIIGTRTFGKGSIQTIKKFADQSSLKYTIGKRYSPNDENINGSGYLPEIELPFDYTGYVNNNIDNQLQKALEVLRK